MASKSLSAHVAKAVSSRRFVAGLSVAELAERVGVSRQAIDQIERGINTPKMSTLAKLADALDCELKDLVP